MSKTAQETKEIYATYKQNVEKFFEDIEKAAPQYLQSITNLQQEFATKAGINTNVPAAVVKAVNDVTEEVIKARSVQNKVILAAIDATKQNIKTFNENAKAFTGLNENLFQFWISACTPTRN